MIVNRKKGVLATVAALAALTACGGGGDDGAGQLSEFQVTPAEVGLTSGDDFCPGPNAKVGDIQVIGGNAPYRITSTDHQRITFGPAGSTAPTNQGTYTVGNRNGQFAVFVTGCLEMPVTVMDDLGRVANVMVTAASGTGS